MDPHRWNDETPATGSQPQPRQTYPRHDVDNNAYGDAPTYGDGRAFGDAPTYVGPGPFGDGPHGDGPTMGGLAGFGAVPGYRADGDVGRDGYGPDPGFDRAGRHGPGPRYRGYGDDGYPDDEYPDDEPARSGWRSRTTIAIVMAFALVVGLATTGWLVLRPSSPPAHQVADPGIGGDPFGSGPASGTLAPSLTSGAPTTAAKPTAKKTTAKPRPTPAQKPPAAQKPPPPPSPVPSSSSCTKHPGPDASTSEVSAALASAGQRNYWDGVVPPPGAPSPMPAFSVPARLMDAFAWTESSWQSTVIACDGGIGLMQLMSDNVAFLNQRFDFSPPLDVNTLNGNAELGAAYIEWLTAYFGTYYFGSYDLMNATAAIGTGGVTLSLLDVVIAAYNVGPSEVEDTHGTPDGSDDTLSIPNQSYVNKVNTAYANQPWLALPPTTTSTSG
jgi:soluble lytic murein transglycosylase-like protein